MSVKSNKNDTAVTKHGETVVGYNISNDYIASGAQVKLGYCNLHTLMLGVFIRGFSKVEVFDHNFSRDTLP